ncbi:MAG: hypothetical protein ABIK18_06070, partial [candidate division WOR-3 bacterium]
MIFFLKEKVVFGGCYECSQGIDCLPGTADCGAGKTCSRFCGGTAIGWYTCCWDDSTPTRQQNPTPTSAPPPGGVKVRPTTPPGGETNDCRIIGCPSGNGIQCCPDGVCRWGSCSAPACSDADGSDDARCIDGEVPGSRGAIPEAQISYDPSVNKIKIYFNPGIACWKSGRNCQDGTSQSFNACWGKLEIRRDGNLIKTLQPPYQGHPDGYLIDFYDNTNPFERHTYSFQAIWDETFPACSNCSHPPLSCVAHYEYNPPPPCQPENLTCSTADCGSKNIILNWNVKNPSGNVVLKRHDGTNWVDVVSQQAAGNMSYTDSPNWGSYNYIAVCGDYGSNQVGCSTAKCPDSIAPNPPTVSASYDSANHRINFSWSWQGDKTCSGCLGPVGFCQSSGTSDQGYSCDNNLNPPFWWQVVRTDNNQTVAYSYDNRSGNQKETSGNASNATSFSYSCAGLEGKTLRIDVRTRDARGNIIPINSAVSASATCSYLLPSITSLTCSTNSETCACTKDDTPTWSWQANGSGITAYYLYRSWVTNNPAVCSSTSSCFTNRSFTPSGLVGQTGTFSF